MSKALWESETYTRTILVCRGWNRDALKVGNEAVLTERRAKDGADRLQMPNITRPSDGWEGVGFVLKSIDEG